MAWETGVSAHAEGSLGKGRWEKGTARIILTVIIIIRAVPFSPKLESNWVIDKKTGESIAIRETTWRKTGQFRWVPEGVDIMGVVQH